ASSSTSKQFGSAPPIPDGGRPAPRKRTEIYVGRYGTGDFVCDILVHLFAPESSYVPRIQASSGQEFATNPLVSVTSKSVSGFASIGLEIASPMNGVPECCRARSQTKEVANEQAFERWDVASDLPGSGQPGLREVS